MDNNLIRLFNDKEMIKRIQVKMPILIQQADIENSRGGSIGMEVGFDRERIIIALLMYYFGEQYVDTNIPTNEAEIDVKLFDNPISIKTISNNSFSGVKLNWTVDQAKANEFSSNYKPNYDMLFLKISWEREGGFYYLPVKAQMDIYSSLDRFYLKLPKPGTNPRGGEISSMALKLVCNHRDSILIPINWQKQNITFNQFTRWIDLWAQD